MKKSAAIIAATALVGGLIAIAPTSAQAASCDDPAHPIEGTASSPDVAVGITKTQTMELAMTTFEGCQVGGTSVVVKSPRTTRTVKLHQVRTDGGIVFWEGSTKIAPKSLRNSDAGTWALTYRATGADAESVAGEAQVRRATRISFNAGPEPVKNHKITYTGKLERADWNKHHYYGYRQQVEIQYGFDPHEESDVVAEPTTTKKGTFKVTQKYPGPGDYSANFPGTTTTAGKHSRYDYVSTT